MDTFAEKYRYSQLLILKTLAVRFGSEAPTLHAFERRRLGDKITVISTMILSSGQGTL